MQQSRCRHPNFVRVLLDLGRRRTVLRLKPSLDALLLVQNKHTADRQLARLEQGRGRPEVAHYSFQFTVTFVTWKYAAGLLPISAATRSWSKTSW